MYYSTLRLSWEGWQSKHLEGQKPSEPSQCPSPTEPPGHQGMSPKDQELCVPDFHPITPGPSGAMQGQRGYLRSQSLYPREAQH